MRLLVLVGLWLCWTGVALGSELFIQWEAPTTRVDDSPLSNDEIIRYNLQVKTPQGDAYQALAPIVSISGQDRYNTTYPLDLVAGEYCFQLQTVDQYDFVSLWSDPACVTYVPVVGPNVPSNILIEIRIKPGP